jgi:hypothetical protein
MAEIIPDQILAAELKETANLSDDEARAEIHRIAIVQPALAEYFRVMTEDSSAGARSSELAMFIAIYRVFEKQCGTLQRVGTKRVEEFADRNEQTMIHVRIRRPGESFLSAAMASSVRQPSLLAYVSQLIFTPDEHVPGLPGFHQDGLMVIMKTVIDVLDSAVRVN